MPLKGDHRQLGRAEPGTPTRFHGGEDDFLEQADALIDALDLGGVLQIASFHPAFQFGGTTADDVTNVPTAQT